MRMCNIATIDDYSYQKKKKNGYIKYIIAWRTMTRKLYRFIRVVPRERNYRNENQVCGIDGSSKGFHDFQTIDVRFRFDYFFTISLYLQF